MCELYLIIESIGSNEIISLARGTKRKHDVTFSPKSVQKLAAEAEEIALKKIKLEQEERSKAKLPDFWLPSLTPTYTSSGVPKDLKDIKVVTTCRGSKDAHEISYVAAHKYLDYVIKTFCADYFPSIKSLVPVIFTYPKDLPPGVKEADRRDGICPSCKKQLSNNHIMYGKIAHHYSSLMKRSLNKIQN